MGCGAKRVMVVAALVALAVVGARWWTRLDLAVEGATAVAEQRVQAKIAVETKGSVAAKTGVREWSAEEKNGRVEKIRRDYEEMRTKVSVDYAAAGAAFPGGLNGFLRQLALLEREMRADIAQVLTVTELEDYEMRETTTGKNLAQRLAGLSVVEEARRAVFRLMREFDDRFSLVFDVSAPALLERTRVQQAMWEKVRAQIGDKAFGQFVRPDDASRAEMQVEAARLGWPEKVSDELWRIKMELVLRRLEIAAQPGLTPEQRAVMRAAHGAQTRSRVIALTGPEVLVPGSAAFGWVPPAQ
jgi:hypothetical protein